MDFTSILGIVLGFGLLEIGYAWTGGDARDLWMIDAFIIVVGGSIGAVVMSFGFGQIRKFPKMMLEIFQQPNSSVRTNIEFLVKLSETARKEGLLSLEKLMDAEKKIDAFLKRGILMVIDGTDSQEIVSLLESEINVYEQQKKLEISMFDSFAGYAPAMGMIGTIIGLIQVLKDMSSPEKLAAGIGVAFLTTLYGVLLANLFFIPAASKLKNRLAIYCSEREMIIEGVCAIRDGINPKMLRDKLSPYERLELKQNDKKSKEKGKPNKPKDKIDTQADSKADNKATSKPASKGKK